MYCVRSLTYSGDTKNKYRHSVLPEFPVPNPSDIPILKRRLMRSQRTISIQITLFVTSRTYTNEIFFRRKNKLFKYFNRLFSSDLISLIGNKIAITSHI